MLKGKLADVSDEYTECNVQQRHPTAKMSSVPYWVLVMSRQPNFVAPNQIKSSDLFVDLVDRERDTSGTGTCGRHIMAAPDFHLLSGTARGCRSHTRRSYPPRR